MDCLGSKRCIQIQCKFIFLGLQSKQQSYYFHENKQRVIHGKDRFDWGIWNLEPRLQSFLLFSLFEENLFSVPHFKIWFCFQIERALDLWRVICCFLLIVLRCYEIVVSKWKFVKYIPMFIPRCVDSNTVVAEYQENM